MMRDDVARLATYVKARRGQLGLSQADVAGLGGPSDTTQSKIENGTAAKVGAQTLAKYDNGLNWPPGTAAVLLAGDEDSPVFQRARNAIVHAAGGADWFLDAREPVMSAPIADEPRPGSGVDFAFNGRPPRDDHEPLTIETRTVPFPDMVGLLQTTMRVRERDTLDRTDVDALAESAWKVVLAYFGGAGGLRQAGNALARAADAAATTRTEVEIKQYINPELAPEEVGRRVEIENVQDWTEQSDYSLAARRTGQRKGSDPAGLDDGED